MSAAAPTYDEIQAGAAVPAWYAQQQAEEAAKNEALAAMRAGMSGAPAPAPAPVYDEPTYAVDRSGQSARDLALATMRAQMSGTPVAQNMPDAFNPNLTAVGTTMDPAAVAARDSFQTGGTAYQTQQADAAAQQAALAAMRSQMPGNINVGYTPAGPLTVVPGVSTGSGTPRPAQPSPFQPQPAPAFNTPMLDALYRGQQQRMTSPAPSFNFQSKPAETPAFKSGGPVGALSRVIKHGI